MPDRSNGAGRRTPQNACGRTLREGLQVECHVKHCDLVRARLSAIDCTRRWPDSDAARRWRNTLFN